MTISRDLTFEQRLSLVMHDIDTIGLDMSYLILSTPTGVKREALTEANIHIEEAKAALKKVGE